MPAMSQRARRLALAAEPAHDSGRKATRCRAAAGIRPATCRSSARRRPAGRPAAASARCGPDTGRRRTRRAAAARPAAPRGRRRPGDEGSSDRRRYRGPRRGVRSRRGPPGRSATTARRARTRPDPSSAASVRSKHDFIPQVAQRGAQLDPRAAGLVAALELLVPLGQPLLGSQHVGAEGRHGVDSGQWIVDSARGHAITVTIHYPLSTHCHYLQMAISPDSPVRMRTASARSVTNILPSPTCPVWAERMIVSNTV